MPTDKDTHPYNNSVSLGGLPREIEICRRYETMCAKSVILTLLHLLVLLCDLSINAWTWTTLQL